MKVKARTYRTTGRYLRLRVRNPRGMQRIRDVGRKGHTKEILNIRKKAGPRGGHTETQAVLIPWGDLPKGLRRSLM